ncbi:Uma2 family endonuclease [Siccirubricoccus sp. KC 17139]|uniref:Uma2 family endonuclease n=1 Tax=Siccirubricoccus soli TaxID=2899147 RepID=A0ABT1DCF8_9PROT|nr:Uma2 family endonuclease [Siccirubricoccus soli]MCO6419628.1 Uma2 family endonuclease [Siccirubricoccus soli]MCP2685763.1 Uma2 family endonuclease [Siccirubricoccus soli]
MDQALTVPPGRMSRAEFYRWAAEQPRGRFELVAGRVVAMSPERGAHLRAKAAIWRALADAIAAAGLPCQALPDGATVEVDDDTAHDPDATVNCGAPMADDAIAAPNPVVVVEVLSPGTRAVDTGAKLTDYFRVPSVQHYLMVRTDRRVLVHHRRNGMGGIDTALLSAGELRLNPPGLTLSVEALFGA